MINTVDFWQEKGAARIAIPLLWVAYGLDRIKLILATPGAMRMLSEKQMRPHTEFEEIFIALILVCSCVFFAWLIVNINHGRRWARNIYFVFSLFDIYSFVSTHSHATVIGNVLSIFVIAAETLAMMILFFMCDGLFEVPSDRPKILTEGNKNRGKQKKTTPDPIYGLGIGLLFIALFSAHHTSTHAMHLAGFISSAVVLILLLITIRYNLSRRKRG